MSSRSRPIFDTAAMASSSSSLLIPNSLLSATRSAILPALFSTTASVTLSISAHVFLASLVNSPDNNNSSSSSSNKHNDKDFDQTTARTVSRWLKTALPHYLKLTFSLACTTVLSGTLLVKHLDHAHAHIAFTARRSLSSSSSSPPSLTAMLDLIRTSQRLSTARTLVILGTGLAALSSLLPSTSDAERLVEDITTAYDEPKLKSIEAVEEARSEVVDENVLRKQRQLLRWNKWRLLGLEVPAWLCFTWLAFEYMYV